MRVPLFFPKHGFRWSKMCISQPSFCLPFGFCFSIELFSLIFLPRIRFFFFFFFFLDKAGVFVGSLVVVPPVFPLFSPCLPCPFVFFLFLFSPFFFFCIYYKFILAEDLCVHLPLLLISLSFSGGLLVEEFCFCFCFLLF